MQVNREWINISDMMSGLMMVFLFIAISFMIEVDSDKKHLENEKNEAKKIAQNYKILEEKSKKIAQEYKKSQESIKEIVMTYQLSQKSLNIDLNKEFEKDLKKWDAEITKDNVFRFKSPDVLFKIGSSEISKKFQNILNDFFPRYIKILTQKKYKNEIDEVRVEGHTSNVWKTLKSEKDIYIKNMQLSQERANNVLSYCYLLNFKEVEKNRKWLEKVLRANGMAFSKLIYQKNGEINLSRSRRVDFKVVTKTQEKLYKIIEELKD